MLGKIFHFVTSSLGKSISHLSGMNSQSFRNAASAEGSRYYFSLLSEDQRKIYDSMLYGIESFAREIKMPILKPINEISMIYNYLLQDNPMIYYTSSYVYITDSSLTRVNIFKPEYKYSNHVVQNNRNAILKYLQVFDSLKTRSHLDKEFLIHDYCLNHFKYDLSFGKDSFNIIGAIFNRTAVCEGIAKFVKLAFDYIGVDSLVVSGNARSPSQNNATESHAWNIVKINGNTFHLDVTFDMTIKNKVNRYDYFNLSDEDIKKDHTVIGTAPVCNTKGYDYFSLNSLLANNINEFERIIENKLRAGQRVITVKFAGLHFSNDLLNQIMKRAQQIYLRIVKPKVMLDVFYNENQMVFELGFR